MVTNLAKSKTEDLTKESNKIVTVQNRGTGEYFSIYIPKTNFIFAAKKSSYLSRLFWMKSHFHYRSCSKTCSKIFIRPYKSLTTSGLLKSNYKNSKSIIDFRKLAQLQNNFQKFFIILNTIPLWLINASFLNYLKYSQN